MSIYKIKIIANPKAARWFLVKIENNASWTLPKNEPVFIRSKNEGSIAHLKLSDREVMLEYRDKLAVTELELYVETTEANLSLLAECPNGMLSISSDKDSHDCHEQSDRFSLLLT